MATNKTDRSFKTLISRETTDSDNKLYFNELGADTINVHANDIWADSIPYNDPAQAISLGVATEETLYVLTEDLTVAGHQSWKAANKDWISPKFGADFVAHLFDASNNEIFPTDPIDWFFDYQTGILTFSNTLTKTTPLKITGYRYSGKKGIVSSGDTNFESTIENLTIPVDYDDDGVGAVGDPGPTDFFQSQASIDDFLATNGWTAFKHFQPVWDVLPRNIYHTVSFNFASGIHRPHPSNTTHFMEFKDKRIGHDLFFNLFGSTDHEERISGLTVSGVGTDDTDPWIDFVGTPFVGKDPRGLTLILDTGQKALVHKFTDSRLYLVTKISPTGPVSGAVGRPATILRNSQKGTETTRHCSTSLVRNVADSAGTYSVLFIKSFTIESINAIVAVWDSSSKVYTAINTCTIDYASQVDDLGLNPSGGPETFIASARGIGGINFPYSSLRGSLLAETPVGGMGAVALISRANLHSWNCYIGGFDNIINVYGGGVFILRDGVVDQIKAIIIEDFSRFTSQAGLSASGVTTILRNFTDYGILFTNGSYEPYSAEGREYQFEDQQGPCIILSNSATIASDGGKILDGGGNLDVGIEVRGSFVRAGLTALTNVTGALGDMRIEGVIGSYSSLPDKTAPLTTINLNSISKEV